MVIDAQQSLTPCSSRLGSSTSFGLVVVPAYGLNTRGQGFRILGEKTGDDRSDVVGWQGSEAAFWGGAAGLVRDHAAIDQLKDAVAAGG